MESDCHGFEPPPLSGQDPFFDLPDPRFQYVDQVEEYLRDVLEIDLARQHAQAALGLPVDEV